jgi:hypothetical protein
VCERNLVCERAPARGGGYGKRRGKGVCVFVCVCVCVCVCVFVCLCVCVDMHAMQYVRMDVCTCLNMSVRYTIGTR